MKLEQARALKKIFGDLMKADVVRVMDVPEEPCCGGCAHGGPCKSNRYEARTIIRRIRKIRRVRTKGRRRVRQ